MPCEDEGISLFFPVYKDEETIELMAHKALAMLGELERPYEIIIVNDGSPDRCGELADALAIKYPQIRVIHHPKNLGYGAAIRTGLKAAKHNWICMVDGDDQYDVFEFLHLLKLINHYDLIITFRYKKIYSAWRIFISWVYNILLRILFRTPFRDISTGLRIVNRRILEDVELTSNSPFIGAELAIKSMLMGYPVGEVGIQTFPRNFGDGSATTWANILATIRDMVRVYKHVFSQDYKTKFRREMD
ncbi:glycosyl transferase, family 2 [Magnetococcus marinus MC-1]|uniref:Glycosyl transferase, family 2 n=1 Tax=Magnetococcus marinus (strain ATCC BAA-1437 / JCM 17883 / MC-1) TaxID=156889 RepID=A0L6R2_MAGMM|nr:glycosyltransferase family 2 protein [Magnetococcus marinus]ABK43655.1 glycosyl transferase, family 2 [Magnetococcus marinus MC-1]